MILHDLSGIGFGERAAEHREVLREDVNQAALDAAIARDEPVAINLLLGHPEIIAAVCDQFVRLFERAFVEQELNALARRHLAFFMLAFAPLRAASVFGELISSA